MTNCYASSLFRQIWCCTPFLMLKYYSPQFFINTKNICSRKYMFILFHLLNLQIFKLLLRKNMNGTMTATALQVGCAGNSQLCWGIWSSTLHLCFLYAWKGGGREIYKHIYKQIWVSVCDLGKNEREKQKHSMIKVYHLITCVYILGFILLQTKIYFKGIEKGKNEW